MGVEGSMNKAKADRKKGVRQIRVTSQCQLPRNWKHPEALPSSSLSIVVLNVVETYTQPRFSWVAELGANGQDVLGKRIQKTSLRFISLLGFEFLVPLVAQPRGIVQ